MDKDYKVDFHLRSKRGRTVMTIEGTGEESRVRAEQEAAKRGLLLYRVTTMEERIN